MSRFLELLRSRPVRELMVVLLISALIWVAGPYVSFAGRVPFESALSRLVAILFIIAGWALLGQYRILRAERASSAIAEGIAAQADVPATQGAPAGGDAEHLRQRFDAATAELRKTKRASLYDLPWYVIIGPPGAGKTTALVNSGLDFSLSGKFGEAGLQGVGGTRNCDWWFADQAVLLDTAGRFTTQDSDAVADQEGWRAFLQLLRKTRPRRPINGVLVALSVSDLITLSDEQRAAQARAVRDRLAELKDELQIGFPIYLLLTKSDLLTGFTEFFDDLDAQGRAQVLGFTVDLLESQRGVGIARIEEEFDALVAGLSDRVLPRLEAERDSERRAVIFGFCEQLAGLKSRLAKTIDEMVPSEDGGARTAWFRGIYLTSGTQQGTPIDRMLGALAKAFRLDVQPPPSSQQSGRAYFIKRLLGEVVFKESSLAGFNPKVEFRRRLLQSAGYAAAGVGALIAVVALTRSYQLNGEYIGKIKESLEVLGSSQASESGLEPALARLDGLSLARDAAARNGEETPWSMRWGLSMVPSVKGAVRDAYNLEANSSVVPAVAQGLESRLAGLGADPDRLYEFLRVYLMLKEPERLKPETAAVVARAAVTARGFMDENIGRRIAQHFERVVREPGAMAAVPTNPLLVERARSSLRNASPARLSYRRFVLTFPPEYPAAIRLDQELGLGSDRVFSRRSGRPLSDVLPGIYTRSAFDEFKTTGSLSLVQSFLDDRWVLGEGAPQLTDAGRLRSKVIALYEKDYIRSWDEVLADLEVREPRDVAGAAELMRLLGSPSSPLRALLILVERETNLTKASDNAVPVDAVAGSAASIIGAATSKGPKPGEKVTEHFHSIHELVGGNPAPIDRVLQRFTQAAEGIGAMSGGLGGESPLAGLGSGGASALNILASEAGSLPGPIASIVSSAGGAAATQAAGAAAVELANLYRTEVLTECRELLANRYPFGGPNGVDAPLADVARVLGSNGAYAQFFDQRLATLVQPNSRGGYRWRPGAEGISGGVALSRFESADKARRVLFESGATTPSFGFNLTPETLDGQATRLILEIDGQFIEYRHGPVLSTTVRWPGGGAGQAAISIDMANGARPNRIFTGPWALFRMLDSATVEPLGGVRYRVRFSIDGVAASVILEALSARNPLGDTSWRRFACL